MKKMFKLLMLSLVALLVIVACNNDTPEEDDVADNGVEAPDDDGTNDDENASDEEDVADEDSDLSGDLLSLGEIGLLETALGDYEVTPTSIRLLEEVGVEQPYNDTFIVMDLTITNVGDEAIVSQDIITARLGSAIGDRGSVSNFDDFEEIDNFEGEIAPGETMTGEIIFDFVLDDSYELSFGAVYLDSLSNEVRWVFDTDEAE